MWLVMIHVDFGSFMVNGSYVSINLDYYSIFCFW